MRFLGQDNRGSRAAPVCFRLLNHGLQNPNLIHLVYRGFPVLWESPGHLGTALRLSAPSLPLKPSLQVWQQKEEAFGSGISKDEGCACAHNIWLHTRCMLNPPHVQEKRDGFAFVRWSWRAPEFILLKLPSPTLCAPAGSFVHFADSMGECVAPGGIN